MRNYATPSTPEPVQVEVYNRSGINHNAVTLPPGFSIANWLSTIVSGGQTGVDRGALDFAKDRKIRISGWCPQGRWAEDGTINESYGLDETPSPEPAQRTDWNARDSDGTLVLVENHVSRGTGLTRDAARGYGRPVWVQPLAQPIDTVAFARWIFANGIRTLNIGGPRESDEPGSAYDATKAFLARLFDLNPADFGC